MESKGLIKFHAGHKAKADEVNYNFIYLLELIESLKDEITEIKQQQNHIKAS